MSVLDDVDRARLGWWAGAVVLAAVLAFVVYSFVGTFVFGVFIYYATRPVYRRLKRYVRPPSLAAAVSLVTLALPALLLLAYVVAVGVQELNAFLDARNASLGQLDVILNQYVNVSKAVQDPEALLNEASVQSALMTAYRNALKYLGFIGNAALHLFVMITIAFYLLRDDHRLAAWFRRRFSDGSGVVLSYTRAVDRDFSNIFFGNILNAVITGLIGAIAYTALDLVSPAGVFIPYPALLGLVTGVASLIPVVGIKLVYVPLAAWLGFQTVEQSAPVWFPVVFVLVSFVIVDVIPDLVLRPYVSGRGLHLGMVMLAYIFGPLLFGWYGIFLGPMLLVLVVHFVRIVLPELLAGEPIEPAALGTDVWTADPAHHASAPEDAATPHEEESIDTDDSPRTGETSESGESPGDESSGERAGGDAGSGNGDGNGDGTGNGWSNGDGTRNDTGNGNGDGTRNDTGNGNGDGTRNDTGNGSGDHTAGDASGGGGGGGDRD